MLIEVVRIYQSSDATLGILNVDGIPFCATLELPFRENDRSISRIPASLYTVTVDETKSHGQCLRVHDVYDRTGILIHVGNTTKDTEGCILVGMSFKVSGIDVELIDSRTAMLELIRRIRVDEPKRLILRIKEVF